jgi:predicted nucleotidyltransferase component of viral defense system
MISVLDLQERVREWGLREDVVEKDYVLGWLLAGIGNHPRLRDTWVFKGGTCLKKCYFETYRFSEDLDFTVVNGGPENPEELIVIFREIAAWVYAESGIEIPADQLRFEEHPNLRGGTSVEGRVYYRGPRGVRGSLPRVKLDVTSDEVLVRPPVRLAVSHPYPDTLPGDGTVLAYSYSEVFAEKIRALGERTRPRDLYDVVHLLRHPEGAPSADEVREVLLAKCEFKGIPVPSMASLQDSEARAELDSDWQHMLAHQLPGLPPLAAFWTQLPELFQWLEGARAPAMPPRVAVTAGEDTGWSPPRSVSVWNAPVSLETIRFAAANRLCVDLRYQGSWRVIEPYSLRRTVDGNYVLHAVRADSQEHRSYRVDRIEDVRVTDRGFVPRYQVEFSAAGPIAAPATTRRSPPAKPPRRTAAQRTRRRVRPTGLAGRQRYIIQCTACGKRFTRSRYDTRLNRHKDKHGYDCFGRVGYLVETRWG